MPWNDGYSYRARAGADAAGLAPAVWLALRYPHSARETWTRRVVAGEVEVDGRPARPDVPLAPGQQVVWHRPSWFEPAAPPGERLLAIDRDVLAVHKPSGLPTVPGGGFLCETLLHRVRALDPAATPMHRLGRATSGVVLFARHAAARADLSAQFRARTVDKRYRLLAAGMPARERFTVRVRIGRVPYPPLGAPGLFAAATGGRPSRTDVRVLDRVGDAFLAEARPVTGRPHQIRIHLAAAGHPLVGDPLYGCGGGPADGTTALPGDGGYRLHARSLTYRHPADGAWRTAISEPDDA